MKEIEKELLDFLIKHWGFQIDEYRSNITSTSKWIAYREEESFVYGVVVCEAGEEAVINIETKEEIQSKFNKKILINVVVVASAHYNVISGDEFYNKVVYSLSEGRVVYSDEGCKPLLPAFNYLTKKQEKAKTKFKDNIVTYSLIAVNIVIFLITAFLSKNIMDIDTYTLVNMGAKVNSLMNEGQWWRLITAAFLHGGLVHIGFNMYALKIIGSEVEYAYGKVKYLLIYFAATLGGSVASYLFNSNAVSVGASGAVFGLLGAMLIFGVTHRDRVGKGFIINIVQVIAINIIFGLSISNIDNGAHLGGLIAGAIVAGIAQLSKR